MDFKSGLFLLFASVVSLVGCDRFLKGTPQNDNVIKVQAKEFECLKVWPAQLKNYLSDQSDQTQTEQIFSCLDNTISAFENFGSGASPDQFTSEELREFFNRYMLKDTQITSGLMQQLMKLKLLLIGGSESVLTRDEFTAVHQWIGIVKQEAQNLRGHWKILLFAEDPANVDRSQLTDTSKLLKNALVHLINSSNAANSNYSWIDFKAFVAEMETFLSASDLLGNLNKWMPIADAARRLFIGDSLDFKTIAGWLESSEWAASVYSLTAQLFYDLSKMDFNLPQTWANISDFIDQGLNLVETSPQMQTQHNLRVQDLDMVIEQLSYAKVLPAIVTPDILKETYRHMLVMMNQGEQYVSSTSPSWKEITGFNLDMFSVLKREFQVWKLSQKEINSMFVGSEKMPLPQVIQKMSAVNVVDTTKAWNLNEFDQQKITRSWSDWLQILKDPHPLVFQTGAHLQLPATPVAAKVSAFSLTFLNILRSFIRVVEIGYGSKPNGSSDIWDSTMSSDDIKQWENDFESFGRAIQFLDPNQSDSASRFYTDSRFFTFSSVGNDDVSSQQLLELISLMISGGKVVADEVMTTLAADQCFTSGLDRSFQKPISSKACFERSFKKNFANIFANLPMLVSEVRTGRLPINDLIQEVEIISNDPFAAKDTITYPEIRSMGGVLHYMEGLMEVYDVNRDQLLSEDEVLAAYPRFQKVMAQLSPLQANWFTQNAFLYIVYTGEKPLSSIAGAADLTSFYFKSLVGLGTVSRLELLRVIAVLKQESDKGQLTPTKVSK